MTVIILITAAALAVSAIRSQRTATERIFGSFGANTLGPEVDAEEAAMFARPAFLKGVGAVVLAGLAPSGAVASVLAAAVVASAATTALAAAITWSTAVVRVGRLGRAWNL